MRALRFAVCVILLIFAFIPRPAAAWTVTGHSVVVEIAVRYLSAQAVERLKTLLDREPDEFADLSTWADDIIRERPETYWWHTVSIPHASNGYVRERDCPKDDCVVERIERFMEVLRDRRGGPTQQAEAVKFLLHFIGDLHVPVHAYAPGPPHDPWRSWWDWEGPWVDIGGAVHTLHVWWDWHFVLRLGPNRRSILESLLARISEDDVAAWQRGTPADWANESFHSARDFKFRHAIPDATAHGIGTRANPIVLDDAVADEGAAIASERLRMAGVRLAWVLNRVLE
ncbi:MAG: S1/P1 nuclease [Alphaproteobacteria bacterium]|nr:S1/P1 nuclease [Alphaproteobacteria bacterium]